MLCFHLNVTREKAYRMTANITLANINAVFGNADSGSSIQDWLSHSGKILYSGCASLERVLYFFLK